ncbi:serine/threonine-protein kinase [Streptomyces sp. NBC_01022]|uniref:serine/threonine-protein kinase n=1 Tax=Streptomyces sp. NBC_01022 TaxID=2903723 RepID=UPI002DD7FD69|nr:serine/threonine-protein kinase [Streptomyces sp. NBC_01022]
MAGACSSVRVRTTLSTPVREGPDSLWRLLRDAAAGLRTVHAAGIVHRDLKPPNVMLTLDGFTLIDFGVARAADQSRLTKTDMVVGTPAYMAPEQAIANQKLTGAADVFALGSLLLYAANGRPPFGDGSGLDLLYRIVHEAPDFGRLPETDPEPAGLLKSCLAKEAADRPTTDELFALASGHVPAAASSLWPPAVTDRITEREAFAGKRHRDHRGVRCRFDQRVHDELRVDVLVPFGRHLHPHEQGDGEVS